MKNTAKKIFAIILLTATSFSVNAQTNVSGGIYTNTTWSLSGSPYIVTSNMVVFPGFILTIQPGVVVKFDAGVQIEIRQSAIVALGTSTDSITFTSNSILAAGAWNNINLNGGTMTSKFNYCNFRYAMQGIADNRGGAGDTIIVKNSSFTFNKTGLFGQGTSYGIIDSSNFRHNVNYGLENNYGGIFHNCDISYNNSTGFGCDGLNTLYNCTIRHNSTGMSNARGCTLNNCMINNNQSGIVITQGSSINNSIIDSNAVVGISNSDVVNIINCQIKNNGIGINDHNNSSFNGTITKCDIENNSTGIQLSVTLDNISCNKICNNTTYDLKYTGVNNVVVANNYWCTADSSSTQAVIYDGHNNITYGLVNFMPLNNSCYLTTGILSSQTKNFQFSIFPNPANNYLTIEVPTTISVSEIKIFNLLGDLEYSSTITGQKKQADISALSSGVYVIQLSEGTNFSRQKLIKE